MRTILLLLVCLPSFSAGKSYTHTAHWTGVRKFVKSPSNQDAVDCEYDLSGNKFWREFLLANVSNCPGTVEVD
jgi:hypothetical protein